MKTRHLSGNENTRAGSHLSSAYLTMSFGPPKLISGSRAIRVGLIQDVTVNQQRTIARFMEVGNNEQWLMHSKVRSSLQLRRVLYDGASLLKYVSYALVSSKADDAWLPKDSSVGVDHSTTQNLQTAGVGTGNIPYQNMLKELEQQQDDMAGAEDFWMNLASDLFAEPIGVMIELKQRMPDGKVVPYGGMFLENCLIANHSFQIMAEQRVLSESVTMEFTRVVPIGENKGKNIQQIELMLSNAFR